MRRKSCCHDEEQLSHTAEYCEKNGRLVRSSCNSIKSSVILEALTILW